VKILICCALEHEALPLVKTFHLKPVHSSACLFTGVYGEHELKLALTGPGKDNIKAAFPEIFELSLPDAVLSYGFAGALSPLLRKGDVLVVNQVMMNDPEIPVFQIPLQKNLISSYEGSFSVHEGALLSTLLVIGLPEEKKSLGRSSDASAVDMESYYLCEEALKRKLKFFAVRGITDDLNENIPAVMQHWTGPNGKILKQKMFQDILKNPGIILPLIRLGVACRKANRHMIQVFRRFLETIQ
jgi:adenosylhomocysteine nucleosidase